MCFNESTAIHCETTQVMLQAKDKLLNILWNINCHQFYGLILCAGVEIVPLNMCESFYFRAYPLSPNS